MKKSTHIVKLFFLCLRVYIVSQIMLSMLWKQLLHDLRLAHWVSFSENVYQICRSQLQVAHWHLTYVNN